MDAQKRVGNCTYKQRHCLGQGSFGKVYQGHLDNGQIIAIKKIQRKLINKEFYLIQSLENQVDINHKLNHPNIVKLYNVITTANNIYLIMEYCSGGDLNRYCSTKKLTQQECKMIFTQVLRGVRELVKQGIVHRDIKPANILVHQGKYKLCDFGFAKAFKDNNRMAKTCVGTPVYMSPQALKQQHYTSKADIWSLGIVYYELLFKKLPYSGYKEDDLYKNIVRNPLKIPPCSSFSQKLLNGMLQVEEASRMSWNTIFQLFEIEPVETTEKDQGKGGMFYKKEAIVQGTHNSIHPQKSINPYLQKSDSDKEITNCKLPFKVLPRNLLVYQELMQNQRDERKEETKEKKDDREYTKEKLKQKAEQKINYENQNQNPRFYYFVLVELIFNPLLDNSKVYQNFIGCMYLYTLMLYSKRIQSLPQNSYRNVLMNEKLQVQKLQPDCPRIRDGDIHKLTQMVRDQCLRRRIKHKQFIWIQRLLSKNYTYKSPNENQ